MNTVQQFWQEVLLLPYKSNSQDNPHHENQVRDLIQKYGYQFEHQPNGPQQSPDFRVTLPSGRVVDIECKSSKQAYPTYNGGLPKEDVIYIFSSMKYDETTVFFADDVVKKSKRELFACLIEELRAVLDKYRAMPEWQDDDRGFDFYIRNMFIQSGGWTRTNYFKHKNRQLCEQNVLNSFE
jgi:hypothetical protein